MSATIYSFVIVSDGAPCPGVCIVEDDGTESWRATAWDGRGLRETVARSAVDLEAAVPGRIDFMGFGTPPSWDRPAPTGNTFVRYCWHGDDHEW